MGDPGAPLRCDRDDNENDEAETGSAHRRGADAVRAAIRRIGRSCGRRDRPRLHQGLDGATPEEVRGLFRRSRIIGRRFQLCHVYSGRDMIEVATFRAPPKDNNHLTEDGMIMRDNVWGNIYQDVVRRDFSINALYYQPFDDIVYDRCLLLTGFLPLLSLLGSNAHTDVPDYRWRRRCDRSHYRQRN